MAEQHGRVEQNVEPEFNDPAPERIDASAQHIIAGRPFQSIDPRCTELWFADERRDLPEPKLQVLLDYWLNKRQQLGHLPDRKDLDILELREAIGNIMMLDVLDDGFDARYRVYGTGIAEFARNDWTGQTVSDLARKTGTSSALLYRACYLAVYRTGRPIYSEHISPAWLSPRAWRRLILPYGTGAGVCAGFMVGNVPVEPQILGEDANLAAQALIYRNR
ncbi:PAS domain-containing protein [Nisaea acidiphila]|uniref:PAS domain-containing protein n=1 Tax=Nisaea acidiphila TaxID=1862145 RepID=A0A9J7AWT8_9PROT|nr:PAS domain-containing protein [Nisaea acidiphila]UUX50716.1 PAS domain-containing protein [Nisaea acidiphila]